VTTNHPPPRGKKLLSVDDDRMVLAMLASGLGAAGYGITTAESAEDAEAWRAGGERPDLAIVDIRMPGHGGLHLAQRLHELDHVPFMMLSAYSDAQTVAQASRHGALGYAVKPLDLPQLIPAIDTALARANELQSLRTTRQQLQAALDAERGISIAIGITMMQYRLPRNGAFEMLRGAARKRRCKLAELATEIIQAAEVLNPHVK
jgi:AmiR/NasT family two-component response regulator